MKPTIYVINITSLVILFDFKTKKIKCETQELMTIILFSFSKRKYMFFELLLNEFNN